MNQVLFLVILIVKLLNKFKKKLYIFFFLKKVNILPLKIIVKTQKFLQNNKKINYKFLLKILEPIEFEIKKNLSYSTIFKVYNELRINSSSRDENQILEICYLKIHNFKRLFQNMFNIVKYESKKFQIFLIAKILKFIQNIIFIY
ncbi:hypothetical protein (nucleomorph) [Guillardia theta]|uniref:Uncharacterized protein n=1 Tax=Guillardia theta TaxID=55529 RepID=Q98S86_GUITH|nr:hypothetical protein GTHECHR3052 [Guillardia theta]AAK39696.1 hypothetical protein [Guillardia theta]